jgi:hypothetical protein
MGHGLHRHLREKGRISLALVIGTKERARELLPNAPMFSIVQSFGIWNALPKCCIECLVDHHQCFWID